MNRLHTTRPRDDGVQFTYIHIMIRGDRERFGHQMKMMRKEGTKQITRHGPRMNAILMVREMEGHRYINTRRPTDRNFA
jgi:hypothetical protein